MARAALAGVSLARWVLRLAVLVAAGAVVYLAVTAVQVWLTGRHYEPAPANAAVVMGAAQYDGVPSPDLRARLDEALALWRQGYVSEIVTTGSKEAGDTYTESEAGRRYLEDNGVPAGDIVEAGGNNSWDNLADAAAELVPEGKARVLVVTDPFHEDRSLAIASSVGLSPSPTPTRSSPIRGVSTLPYYAKETVGVALGRIIGFQRLNRLHGLA